MINTARIYAIKQKNINTQIHILECLFGSPNIKVNIRFNCNQQQGAHMTHLTKLTFKTVDRSVKRDPIIARRDKLVAGLKEQKLVHAATLKKEDHLVERDKWMQNELGERVLVKTHRCIRPWFFEQDGGWYVQCRYGARVITADGTNNAVFVKSLADVLGVLDALLNAAAAGELDTAIIQVAERKPAVKPGAAKAAAHA